MVPSVTGYEVQQLSHQFHQASRRLDERLRRSLSVLD